MHKKFIRKRIKTAKNAKEVKGIQKNFNRNAKGMHQNFRGSSQENIAIVVQTKYDEKMACLMNFFWNYAAVPLHCSCSFYRIEFFSKIDSNLIKQRKRSSHVYHFFSNQLPSFAQHWLQLNLNLPKQIPGYFDPAAQVKPNPTHVNPSRSYISMQQINAIILIICYYVTIALGLPTFNPNAQTTSRKNPSKMNRFELPFMITNRS